jgi:hypothetical protein
VADDLGLTLVDLVLTKIVCNKKHKQTNSNLEQLRPTQDELVGVLLADVFHIKHCHFLLLLGNKKEKRRQAHLSKNIDLIKAEKQRQSILKAKKIPSTEIDTKTQLALLREILMDDNQVNMSDCLRGGGCHVPGPNFCLVKNPMG